LQRAIRGVLPTLAGETVLTLKATPIAATITVLDIFGVVYRVRQATYLTYEPLLFAAAIYMTLTLLITRVFRYFELQIPTRRS
jgi:polar amino acid transport system permease protein